MCSPYCCALPALNPSFWIFVYLTLIPDSLILFMELTDHHRMTGLWKKTHQLTVAEYSTLITEAGYWLQHSTIQEDSTVSALAAHTENWVLAEEVYLNLREVWWRRPMYSR